MADHSGAGVGHLLQAGRPIQSGVHRSDQTPLQSDNDYVCAGEIVIRSLSDGGCLMIPDPFGKTVKIPIKIVNGCPCLDLGERLPELEDGTLGDLIVPAYAFKNPKDFVKYLEEESVLFLKEGTILIAQIDSRHVPKELEKSVIKDCKGMCGTGVLFVLCAEQEILTRGTKNAALKKCECEIPVIEKTAVSINHAYSLISQAYEPHRVSHTGNVFAKVFFKKGECWRPLKDLRGY